jgi:hypothetical protein
MFIELPSDLTKSYNAFKRDINIAITYTVKKVHEFPVSSRDVTNQTPLGQE